MILTIFLIMSTVSVSGGMFLALQFKQSDGVQLTGIIMIVVGWFCVVAGAYWYMFTST